MINLLDLKNTIKQFDFREKRSGIYKVICPFFHEDGDMYDMFVEECPKNNSLIRISDHGLTLMKLSYDFDIDTDNKQNVLESIVLQNRCQIDDGDIYIDVNYQQCTNAIYQLSQVISKVSNMDIISKESMKSYFYEFLNDFIMDALQQYKVRANIYPTNNRDLKVDYELPAHKPIYIFGVNDNAKASKVVISCLSFITQKKPFKSLIIHENIDSLSMFNKNQIINTADKIFTDLDSFKEKGKEYIEREIA